MTVALYLTYNFDNRKLEIELRFFLFFFAIPDEDPLCGAGHRHD